MCGPIFSLMFILHFYIRTCPWHFALTGSCTPGLVYNFVPVTHLPVGEPLDIKLGACLWCKKIRRYNYFLFNLKIFLVILKVKYSYNFLQKVVDADRCGQEAYYIAGFVVQGETEEASD